MALCVKNNFHLDDLLDNRFGQYYASNQGITHMDLLHISSSGSKTIAGASTGSHWWSSYKQMKVKLFLIIPATGEAIAAIYRASAQRL